MVSMIHGQQPAASRWCDMKLRTDTTGNPYNAKLSSDTFAFSEMIVDGNERVAQGRMSEQHKRNERNELENTKEKQKRLKK
jgi:hypothetical protein